MFCDGSDSGGEAAEKYEFLFIILDLKYGLTWNISDAIYSWNTAFKWIITSKDILHEITSQWQKYNIIFCQ